MNILSIGNSFSTDAQRYLHRIAKADGIEINTFNLFIGGCSLSTHYSNILSGEKAYELEINGESTGLNASLEETLLSRDWDIITLQQVSNEAPYYDTYQPYLDSIIEFVRKCVPKAKIVMHQTWAYEEGSYRLNTELGYTHHQEMFRDIEKAYSKAAEAINADFIIPSGALFQKLIQNGIQKVHRDTDTDAERDDQHAKDNEHTELRLEKRLFTSLFRRGALRKCLVDIVFVIYHEYFLLTSTTMPTPITIAAGRVARSTV